MKSLIILGLMLSIISCDKYEDAMKKLDDLEKYANDFYKNKSQKYKVDHLILSYIRTGKYDSEEWLLVAGETPTDFINYVTEQDEKESKSTSDLRKYESGDIVLPDVNESATDFVHMFGIMNAISYQSSFTKNLSMLKGWAEGTAKLFQDIFNETDPNLEQLIEKAKEFLGKKGGFGKETLISDLDAVGYLALKQNNSGKSYSEVFGQYLKDLNISKRVEGFLVKNFKDLCKKEITQNEFREAIYKTYDNIAYIKIWECEQGLREEGSMFGCYNPGPLKEGKENNRKAASYAFADFLFEYKPNIDPTPSNSNYNKYCFLLLLITLFLMI